ncbi:hypothetical protein DJ95_3365 [Bacillus atrophaeus subsp. globigii]|uniref:YxjJ n=1 Tax=Bacillus atrophaeus (strain 1942) TaxID=720555 RepID=A0ABM5M2L5_BACA1|nr:hypothetical protein BATR1942_17425 [Bacillus atrophaeus 1942]AIK47655.1 hypothetical protein DJ95_3365 [Bacillus atrophaeus subsp. globigii]AKL86896.1 YxjJ [Bacillus atrophaeus UCMB-5137]AMR60942.1 hypothetical protein A1D11_00385 [Bacillus subtilis subsp. globigii]EIM11374.1 hypothetical protein UY9_07385 [Bacillus atrophaeus C89]KFK83735.1 hypothetical protein DK44_266 [Bacillus atrophaeus]MBT2624883.1 hypothetical protein [Bacillus sp. ISL-32]MCI3195295.1 hypothetical protein [Bacillu
MILSIIIALCGYLLYSFSKDNRRKTQKTSPLATAPAPVSASAPNNLIDLDAIRQKRQLPLS